MPGKGKAGPHEKTGVAFAKNITKTLLNADVLNILRPNCPPNLYFSFRGLSFSFRAAVNLPGKGEAGPKENNGDPVGKI